MPKVRQQFDIHSNVLDKQAELEKKSKVYSTEKIKDITSNVLNGGKADTTPFFHGSPDWRDSGVIFEYTDEELEIMDKCSNDCVWFVENYAKFMNKKGRSTVKLYDFQKENLKTMSGEHWDPEEDVIMPDNPMVCLLQSRQTSKCLSGNSIIDTKEYGKIKLYELYFNPLSSKSIIDKIIYYAYKLNDTKLFKNKLTNIIYKLESIKFGKNHQEKLIEKQDVQFEIKSKDQYNHATQLFRTKPFEIYHLELENGLTLDGADNHRIYASINFIEQWMFIKDLTKNHYVLTENGWIKVKSIVNTHQLQYMYDISVEDEDHSYYSNGILSHNTTTISAYIAWYSIFHNDRNIFICANKGSTATEIMGKVKSVLEGLPFFLKPGIVNIASNRIKLENGTCIKCAAASKTPATGDSIHLLYIDECALIPKGVISEYWASVIPTMSSLANSQIIVSSTPRGTSGKFYEIVESALKKTEGWILNRVDWWQVPGHDEKWLEKERKKMMDDDLFEREYKLSFESDSTRLISPKSIVLMNKIKQDFVHREFNHVPLEISNNILWAPDFNPTYMDYETLYRKSFLFVVDTAQGIEQASVEKEDSDYNIINIFEIEPLSPNRININRNGGPISIKDCVQYKQVGLYIDNFKDETQCAEAAKYIAFQILKTGYGEIDNVRILIEMNFNGNNWINKFKHHPTYYDALILKTIKGVQKPGQPITKMKEQYGFRTTGGEHGKNYYCELGAKMIHNRQILVRQHDQDVNHSSINELDQFGKNKKKNTYEGSLCHDDIAITCLFISIAPESRQFIKFLNEWIEKAPQTEKLYKIGQMLNILVEKEAQLTDDQFDAFYKTAGANFRSLRHKQNGYGALMQGNAEQNLYNNSGFQQGFGNMLSGRRF